MIRLVLVDDQPGVRQGLRMWLSLEPDMTVVGEASNGREAIALVQQLAPDVVLMDVEMPEMDGFGFSLTNAGTVCFPLRETLSQAAKPAHERASPA